MSGFCSDFYSFAKAVGAAPRHNCLPHDRLQRPAGLSCVQVFCLGSNPSDPPLPANGGWAPTPRPRGKATRAICTPLAPAVARKDCMLSVLHPLPRRSRFCLEQCYPPPNRCRTTARTPAASGRLSSALRRRPRGTALRLSCGRGRAVAWVTGRARRAARGNVPTAAS
jgi:hypothetical protein